MKARKPGSGSGQPAAPACGESGEGNRRGKATGCARGLANGEFWSAKRRVKGRGNANARGPLGKVKADGTSELGKYFGLVVRVEMEWQGYNQRGLANLAKMRESTLSLLLNAKHTVWMSTAEKVADSLGFVLEELLTRARDFMETVKAEAIRAAVLDALKTSFL